MRFLPYNKRIRVYFAHAPRNDVSPKNEGVGYSPCLYHEGKIHSFLTLPF
jgi:hypothetical protein